MPSSLQPPCNSSQRAQAGAAATQQGEQPQPRSCAIPPAGLVPAAGFLHQPQLAKSFCHPSSRFRTRFYLALPFGRKLKQTRRNGVQQMQLHEGQEREVVGQKSESWPRIATRFPFLVEVLGKFKNNLLYLSLSWAPADEPLSPSTLTSWKRLQVSLPFPCGKGPYCTFFKLTFS